MHKTLRLGDKGKEVLTVQQALKICIAPKLELTGYFGKHTEAAVRQFQERAGFRGKDLDGIVGPKTTVALFQMFDVKMKGRLAPPRVPIAPPAKLPAAVPSGNGKPVPPLPPSRSLRRSTPCRSACRGTCSSVRSFLAETGKVCSCS